MPDIDPFIPSGAALYMPLATVEAVRAAHPLHGLTIDAMGRLALVQAGFGVRVVFDEPDQLRELAAAFLRAADAMGLHHQKVAEQAGAELAAVVASAPKEIN